MDRLVASGRPACATPEESKSGVVNPTDHHPAAHRRGVMALQAKVRIPNVEQFVVNRAVRRVTRPTALRHCFVLKNERTSLCHVTTRAQRLRSLQLRRSTGRRPALVWFVTIDTGHRTARSRVTFRKHEITLHVYMALETGVRIAPRVVNRSGRSACIHVPASRAVTPFTPRTQSVFTVRHEGTMRRILKIRPDIIVTEGALFRPDEFRPGDARRRHHHAPSRRARDKRLENQHSADRPEKARPNDTLPDSLIFPLEFSPAHLRHGCALL